MIVTKCNRREKSLGENVKVAKPPGASSITRNILISAHAIQLQWLVVCKHCKGYNFAGILQECSMLVALPAGM